MPGKGLDRERLHVMHSTCIITPVRTLFKDLPRCSLVLPGSSRFVENEDNSIVHL